MKSLKMANSIVENFQQEKFTIQIITGSATVFGLTAFFAPNLFRMKKEYDQRLLNEKNDANKRQQEELERKKKEELKRPKKKPSPNRIHISSLLTITPTFFNGETIFHIKEKEQANKVKEEKLALKKENTDIVLTYIREVNGLITRKDATLSDRDRASEIKLQLEAMMQVLEMQNDGQEFEVAGSIMDSITALLKRISKQSYGRKLIEISDEVKEFFEKNIEKP